MARVRSSGFTLVELMIVVAIIAVVAAVAIPSLQNARKSAVEAKAIGLCKQAVSVNEAYRTRFGSYPPSGDDLLAAGYIFDTSDYLTEYWLVFQSAGNLSWSMTLGPAAPGVTADRSFYVDNTGVIRYSESGTADSTSPPLD